MSCPSTTDPLIMFSPARYSTDSCAHPKLSGFTSGKDLGVTTGVEVDVAVGALVGVAVGVAVGSTSESATYGTNTEPLPDLKSTDDRFM